MTPTARSLAFARQSGYTVEVVERWIAQAGVRKDFLGCIDAIALRPGCPILGIQATSRANVSARVNKARMLPGLRTWLAVGCEWECWGWFLTASGRWDVHRVSITGAELACVPLTTPRRRRQPKQAEMFFGEPS
jgi:hypothetical protein